MAGKFDDDDHVANLLKQDARNATKKYELVGIDAFNPKRLKSGAPKPNTSFLRHIIRQTDSHNAALLAKEAEESNARLKMMNRERERDRWKEEDRKRRKADGRLTPSLSDNAVRQNSSTRRSEYREDRRKSGRRQKGRERSGSREVLSKRHRDRSVERRRDERRHDCGDDDRSARKRRRPQAHRDEERRDRYSSEEEDARSQKRGRGVHSYRRGRSYSRSTSQSRSRSPRSRKNHGRRRRRDRSHTPQRAPKNSRPPSNDFQKSKRRSASPTSDSDPLEALVGPLPHSAQSPVRARGRGAHKANAMGMDARFSSTYDPTVDVHPGSDAEDDWGDALEAFRDRQRWKQRGADRLKAAGFTDEQVQKWERGDNQNEDDVVWTRKGQAREWDRGKAVDEDGDVELKVDFGRLK